MRQAISHAPLPLGEQFAYDLQRLDALRLQVEMAVEMLIGLLDAMDGDTDLEPTLAGYSEGDGADAKPSLGCQNDYDGSTGQARWGCGPDDDREGDDGGESGIGDLDGLLEQTRSRSSYTMGGME